MRIVLALITIILSIAGQAFAQANSDSIFTISDIQIQGNKKTKANIILCEIEFKKGDTISLYALADDLERSKTNLDKLALFNYVTIVPSIDSISRTIDISITVEERWYIWPQFNITPHNGNLNDWLRNPDLDLIDYCVGVKKYNFRGRREVLYINLRRGFNNITQIGYQNIALDRPRHHLLSFSAEIKRQKSLVIKTLNNEAFYSEFAGEKNAISSYHYEGTYTYRPTTNISNNFTAGYFTTSVCDSVAITNPNYLGYGRKHVEGVFLKYELRINNRNSNYYPLKGSFLSTSITKRGVMSNSIDTYTIMGDIRKYWVLSPRQYLASQLYISSSSHQQPFCFMNAIGFKPNIIEGYEYNMIAGERISYLRTSYKFQIIKQHILHLKRINIPKFNKIHYAVYLNTFANAGYVSPIAIDKESPNTMNDTFLGALGIGLDLVTYYDRVLKTYITRNMQGNTYFGIGFITSF